MWVSSVAWKELELELWRSRMLGVGARSVAQSDVWGWWGQRCEPEVSRSTSSCLFLVVNGIGGGRVDARCGWGVGVWDGSASWRQERWRSGWGAGGFRPVAFQYNLLRGSVQPTHPGAVQPSTLAQCNPHPHQTLNPKP
eukprot:49272-Chlamydomonas_euryale.AAC.1